MTQSDVYWHTFLPPDKRRPVVILSRPSVIPYLNSVIVASVTSTIRNTASEVLLSEDDGLNEECVANLDNIYTVQKSLLGDFITHLQKERMREIREAIEFALGFDAME